VCTVSVVPAGSGFRLACNRDERRTRPRALAPRIHSCGARRALWPCDPQSGGTWIGVNDRGLAIVLLNRTVRRAAGSPFPTLSRGALIPRLLGEPRVDAAVERALSQLHPRNALGRFEAFTLVMVQCDRIAIVEHRPNMTAITLHRLQHALLFTSSSLGDEIVDPPRRRLFAGLMHSTRDHLEAQARFHRHRWRDRPHLSVRMSREDAATVSHTVVDVSKEAIAVRYVPTI